MWARVSRYCGAKDKIDEAAAFVRDELSVSLTLGFRRALFFADRETGRALTVTLWETEEAMRASADAANQFRSRVNVFLQGTRGPTVEEFELLEDIVPGSGTRLYH